MHDDGGAEHGGRRRGGKVAVSLGRPGFFGHARRGAGRLRWRGEAWRGVACAFAHGAAHGCVQRVPGEKTLGWAYPAIFSA